MWRVRFIENWSVFWMCFTCTCMFDFMFQGELFIGDQSGSIHIWDLKTDKNVQLVSGEMFILPVLTYRLLLKFIDFFIIKKD